MVRDCGIMWIKISKNNNTTMDRHLVSNVEKELHHFMFRRRCSVLYVMIKNHATGVSYFWSILSLCSFKLSTYNFEYFIWVPSLQDHGLLLHSAVPLPLPFNRCGIITGTVCVTVMSLTRCAPPILSSVL